MRYLAFAVMLFLSACASTRETPLSDAQLGALVQGQTTRVQAVALLGEPVEERSNKEGIQLVYVWRLGQTNNIAAMPSGGISSASVEVQQRQIVLSFDGKEVLRDIERTTRTIRNGVVNVAPQLGS